MGLNASAAVTQAAILTALGAAIPFEDSATFPGGIAVGGVDGVMRLSTGILECTNAADDAKLDMTLVGSTLTFSVSSDGSINALVLNANGSATFSDGIILPTADPGIAGAWWDNAGTLAKSSG